MEQRYLLDTSAVLAHTRREAGWEYVQTLFEQPDIAIFVASVSLTELCRRLCELGATAAEAHQIVAGYQQLLDEVVAVDEQVALTAFTVWREAPKRLPLIDTLIAAAAAERNASLVHRDQHMAALPEHVVRQIDLSTEAG